MKRFIKALLAVMCIIPMTLMGCGNLSEKNSAENNTTVSESTENINDETKDLPIATIEVENYGTIEAELYPEAAPNTVNNFISLANSGFYNKLTFHRVIKNFMIQGGDPVGNGTGGPGYGIKGEFTSNGFANSLKHTEGVLSMARKQNDMNSAGSQFFIMTKDNEDLDGQYAAFGKVISGMDVVKKISEVKTGKNDKPDEDVVIKSITVDTKGIDYQEPKVIK